jgi:hypothetical protein
LVRSHGFAATRTRVDCPGRNFVHCSGAAMRIEIIGGRRATNRAGAAEYLEMPIATVQIYSSPARRPTSGWPEPLENPPGLRGVWFALDDLDGYKARRTQLASSPPAVAGGDLIELVDVTEFARLRGVSVQVFNTYVQASRVAWDRGEHGMLPRPLPAPAPARHGLGRHYQWLRGTAIAWAFPERPRRSTGREKGPRPGVDDL